MTLIKVRYKEADYRKPRWPEDIASIVRALAERGYEISHNDARMAWEDYSQSMCAQWLCVPESSTAILCAIEPYLEGVE